MTKHAPPTEKELTLLDEIRNLKPYESLKISKNQNGQTLSICVERRFLISLDTMPEKSILEVTE
jgi:hypothetical protein